MGGVIAAGSQATAVAGATILTQGGNAVDAAVAAAFASFIAEAGVVHLGGSGIAHLYDAQNGRSQVYDFFSNAPGLGAAPPHKIDFAGVTIDFGSTTQDFHLGRASVAVPGNIFGLCQMAADHGRLPLTTLLQPALQLAQEGVILDKFQTDTARLLEPLYTHTPAIRQIFAPNGRLLQAGEKIFIPDLAHTLAALAAEGETFIRSGRLAQAILQDQQANGGLLTPDDLRHYTVHQPNSIRIPYRDYEVLLPPLSSVGGIFTAFTLKLLSRFELHNLGYGTARHLQLLYEIMAATTRARALWDSQHDAMPLHEFLDEAFIGRFHTEIEQALWAKRPSAILPEAKSPNNTSHLSVIDDDGLAVSLTTSAGESAGYVVPGTGFIPNNMMGEEDLHPLGFHTRPAGQRIATMMTPAIVLKNNQPRLVTGSGGSARIRSAILQVLSNLLDFGLTLQDTVQTARVHIENGVLQCEAGYNEPAIAELERLGYPVNRWQTRSLYFGGAHTVSRTENGRLVGAGDNRRGGATAVV
ncbi:MAG: gamma-glutamyltransferase [Ardenticatenaceae bacterium]|nr:gamma-glutamyltransferase [Ardenticatenaceae bacterium]